MKLADGIKKIFNRASSDNAVDINDPHFWRKYGNSKGALSEITYMVCLKTLAESVGKLPLKLYQDTDKGIRKATELKDYQLLKLRPNKHMTAAQFYATNVINMYHYGNAFSYINESQKCLDLLDSRYVRIYDDNAKILTNRGGLWYVYHEPKTGTVYKFSEDEILHFRTSLSFDGITGMSILDILRTTIDGSVSGQEFLNDLYSQGMTGKVAVEYTGELSEGHRKKLISTFETAIDGNSGINFIPVPAGIKLNPLDMKLADSQFNEIRKYTALQIASAFGIKPNQINDYEKSSYANSEAQQRAFYADTLLYLLTIMEQEMTYKKLSDEQIKNGYYYKFNVDVLLRADFATRMEGYAKARQNGFMNADEIREKEDMPNLPNGEGKIYLVNGNMMPINSAKGGGEGGN